MPEHQNIEYKSSWHDDYLKWICGFANANGGTLFIGKDDKGKVVGVEDYKHLMDEIPNRVRSLMGLMPEVNLHEEKGKHYIEIIVPAYSVPISLRGRFYYRSGSTKQELTGASLNEFLLKRSGKTWDDMIESDATFEDIDEQSVRHFLNTAEKAERLPDSRGLSTQELFEKLKISDNGKLKRAAIILFGKDPGRFYPNTFVKIGRFGKSPADLKFQVVEEGNLFQLIPAVLDQLTRKFLTSPVQFEGLLRVEKGEYPMPALREMLLNALIHRNYMGSFVQIRVEDDQISIWNEGYLPEGITLESLKTTHSSRPRNPKIADVIYKSGYIDAWGRGTVKIIEVCKEAGLPEPEMKEKDGGFWVTLFKPISEDYLLKLGLNDRQLKAVEFAREKGKITNKDYQEMFQIGRAQASRDLAELVEKGILKSSKTKGAGSYYEIIAP